MQHNYQIDKIDGQILTFLQKNARMPYTEIAKKCDVSSGTIHQRLNKMQEAGIIKGSQILLDYSLMGYDVTVLIGIHLVSGMSLKQTVEELSKIQEVVEVYYTTGNFGLFIRVILKSISQYYEFLVAKLQVIPAVQSTESFICLKKLLDRDIQLV